MATELASLDISTMPDLARLADEVRATGRPRRLRRADEDIAVLVPAPTDTKRRARKTPTAADDGAFLATAGGWQDHLRPESGARIPAGDGDPFLRELARRRRGGLSVTERTAGALRRYAKDPPATREEEKEAFAQAVAEEVAGHPRA